MNMKFIKAPIFFLCVLLISALAASSCKQRAAEAPSEVKAREKTGHLFVGCAPSVGECTVSCPMRDGTGVEDESLCQEREMPYACSCPYSERVRPEAPSEDTHRFVGCVVSPGECRNSCPTRKIITFQGADDCETLDFACYCSIK